jgi:hypothetical protein
LATLKAPVQILLALFALLISVLKFEYFYDIKVLANLDWSNEKEISQILPTEIIHLPTIKLKAPVQILLALFALLISVLKFEYVQIRFSQYFPEYLYVSDKYNFNDKNAVHILNIPRAKVRGASGFRFGNSESSCSDTSRFICFANFCFKI